MKAPLLTSAALAALTGILSAQNLSVTFDEPAKALQHGSILSDSSYADVGLTLRAGFTSVYDTPERNAERAFALTLTDSTGASSPLSFAEILARNPTVTTGDHFANEYAAITASSVGLSNIKAATFELDGSGAIDTLTFTVVPEPSTRLLAGLAALGLLVRRRR